MMISIVAPMYNEALSIAEYLDQLLVVLESHFSAYEVIIVDDGSKDDSIKTVLRYIEKHTCIRLIQLSRNFGKEIATAAGLQHTKGDRVALMDTDLQHPPSLLPALCAKLDEGYDAVYAARKSRKNESWLKRFTSKWFYRLARMMTGFDLPSDGSDFRVMTKEVVNALNQMDESSRYSIMMYAYVGYTTGFIPFDVPPRFAGKPSYNYRMLVRSAMNAIFSFSAKPLRIASLVSLTISGVSAIYAGFIFIQHFLQGNFIDGMASMLCFTAVMFSLLFLCLSLLSEYIGRIMLESKKRPLYFVRQQVNLKKSMSSNENDQPKNKT